MVAKKKKAAKKQATTKPAVKKKKKAAKKPSMSECIQPSINIGLCGHVDHGKTTLLQKLSGKWADTHSEEIKRGITIRLGYADVVFRKCTKCKDADAYTISETCEKCGEPTEPLRKVSFVDAPGHESLMATMLAGATIMDGAMLLVAANEECPQPQTKEHLMALSIIGIKNIIVLQNKIDLVSEEQALKNYKQIKNFLKGTDYEDAPIVPISAQHGLNIDFMIQAIEETIPTPERDESKDPMMVVARSFDINKPGTAIPELSGAVLGGSLKQGKFVTGEEIEIRPGRKVEEKNQVRYEPIKTKIDKIVTGGCNVEEVLPGGSIAVSTMLDPMMAKSDSLAGSLVSHPGKLPDTKDFIELETHLLERVVGSKADMDVEPIKKTEILMLNVNSTATVGVVTDLGKNVIKCKLKLPICAFEGSRVTISRRLGNRFRLIGYGILK